MIIDIEALEAAAKAATPGPWVRGRFGGIYPDDENTRGPCVVHAQYADHTSRPNAEANETFVAAANPKVVLGLLRRLRDAEGNHAASCIYCGEAIIYDTRKVDDMEAAHRLLMEHDRQCPKNPVAQRLKRLQAVEQENERLTAENERLASISPHGHVLNTRDLMLAEEKLEAATDYAEDRARMLGMVAERLGVAGEPHQGKDEQILEALDTLIERSRRMEEAIDFACAPDMWEERTDLAGEVYEYKYLEWYVDVLQEALTPHELHPDDAMVEAAALAMRKKLADKRGEGRGGWETCSIPRLNSMLVNHIAKGDPVDVLNFAAMIHALGGRTSLDRAAPRQPGEAPPWYVTDDKPWFAYCPDQGLMAFGTEAEAVEQATDFIDSWLDGDTGWDEQVDQVFVGRATQISSQVDRVDRPDESQLDEDGCDPEGYHWGDYDYVCNYKLQPVVSDAAKAWAATSGGDTSGYDLVAHMKRQIAFSTRAFGPGSRCQGVTDHIRKELKEIEAAPHDLEEWIDVASLALDGAWRAGYSAEEVAAGLGAKLVKNEGRDWPDWRTVDPTKAIEHNRQSEES